MTPYHEGVWFLFSFTACMATEDTLTVALSKKDLWLQRQPPSVQTTVIEEIDRLLTNVASPDVLRLQKEYRKSVDTLTREHQAEMMRLNACISTQREIYREEFQQLLRTEVARQVHDAITKRQDTDFSDSAKIHEAIERYYDKKKRLPRNAGDLMRETSDEERHMLVHDATLFDVVLANVKRDHYRSCGNRKQNVPKPMVQATETLSSDDVLSHNTQSNRDDSATCCTSSSNTD